MACIRWNGTIELCFVLLNKQSQSFSPGKGHGGSGADLKSQNVSRSMSLAHFFGSTWVRRVERTVSNGAFSGESAYVHRQCRPASQTASAVPPR